MTRKELIAALQEYDDDKTVIVKHLDRYAPAYSLADVSYCKAFPEYGDSYILDHAADLKKCAGCKYNEYNQCEQTDGIGQYMVRALLIVGESCSMPSTGSGASGSDYYKINFALRQEVLKREDGI